MRVRCLLAILLALLMLSAAAAPVSAIPAFARKYRVSCTLCHTAPPKLNSFGEDFAANGFELQVGETPTDTISTGDALLRLQRDIPLAMRIDMFVQLRSGGGRDATNVDFQTPWMIKLLSGGQIADRVSYYLYFFLSERGEVAGLEDAYVQFTDVAGSGVSLMVGQFQVSDPLFKRELRLTVEDYQPYRVRVGDARADLTYERGIMAVWSPWEGADVAAAVVNGEGLEAAGEQRTYDGDDWKNYALRFSQSLGVLRLGGFVFTGQQERPEAVNEIVWWGPDLSLTLGANAELNAQFLRRSDDDPFFRGEDIAEEETVDAAMVELGWAPQGHTGRLFLTGLFNWVSADRPVFSVRTGEDGLLEQYTYGAGSASWLMRRNLRMIAEAGWDFEQERARFTFGVGAAF